MPNDVYDKEREETRPIANQDSGGMDDDEANALLEQGDSGYYADSDEEQSDAHDELAAKETDGSGPKKGKKDKKDEEERDPNLLYKEGDFDKKDDGKKRLLGRKKKGGGLGTTLRNRKRALMIAGFGSLAALGLTIAGSIFMPAFELVHIKEIMLREYGGIQSQVVTTRSGKVFSRGFFFHEGEFDGYKSRGKLTSIYKNIQSDKFVADMRANGYDFKMNTNRGTLSELIGPDGTRINTADQFESIWKRRSAIKEAIAERHSGRSAFWRGRKARAVFKRYGLIRKNWIRDNRVVDWLERKELELREKLGRKFNFREKFKAKMRGALMGLIPGYDVTAKGKGEAKTDPGPDDPESPDPERERADADIDQAASELDDANKLADEIAEQVDADPAGRIAGDVGEESLERIESEAADIAGKTVKEGAEGAAKGAIGGFAAVADYSCQAYAFAQAVRGASRVMRAMQLAKFATAIFVMADSVKDGDIDGQDMAGFMALAHTLNKSTGKSFYSSGSWNYVSNKRKNPGVVGRERNRYSVDGKIGGDLGSFLDAADHYLPTKGICKVAGNPIFQIATSATELVVVRIGGGIATGGTLTATAVAASAASAGAISATLEIAKAVLLPILARTLAGAVITGDESGDNLAAALVSGAGAMSQMRGHSMGMKPLKNRQVFALQQEVDETRRTELAKQSLFERYISLGNPTSLASTSLISGYSQLANVGAIGSMSFAGIPAMFGSVLDVTTNKAFAAEDPDEIAHDAFGNPIMGLPDNVTETIDPGENERWMMDQNYVDEAGKPVPDSEFDKFKKSCIDPVDVEYNSSTDTGDFGERTECKDNSEEKNRMRVYVMDLDLSTSISDNITGDLSDTSDDEPIAPTPSPAAVNKSVYMIGDSLTVGYNNVKITDKFQAAGWTSTINAVGGQALTWGVQQIDAHTAEIARAGTLVIALGTNALETPDGYGAKIVEAVDKARAANPNISIYFVNIYSGGAGQAKYDTYNNILKLQAIAKNFKIIDLKAYFDDGRINRSACITEAAGVHPGANCYTILAQLIVNDVVAQAITGETGPTPGGTLPAGERAQLVNRIFNNPGWKPQTNRPTVDIQNGVAKDGLVQLIVAMLEQAKVTLEPSVIQTGHNPCTRQTKVTSNHYGGYAIDIGNESVAPQLMPYLYNNRAALNINELIYSNPPPGTSNLKQGEPHSYGSGTLRDHANHIHVSVKGPRILAGCPND